MKAKQIKVGYLGPGSATFGYMAANKFFGQQEILSSVGEPTLLEFDRHPKIVEAVSRREIDVGIVAYENALEGVVNETVNRVVSEHRKTGISILAEVRIPITMCAMRKPGFDRQPITKVVSHEVGLRQCDRYVDSLMRQGAARESVGSTGQAAQVAAKDGYAVALAPRGAADEFGLVVIGPESVADYKENATNFWALSHLPPLFHTGKTCVLVNLVRDKPGGLYRTLGAFANRGLNLATMNKVPIPETNPREYDFLFEIEAALDDHKLSPLADALKELRFNGLCISETPKVLGSYPVIT